MEWLWTRTYRHLLMGIPAIVLLMPLMYCAIRLPFHTNEAKAKHYQRAAAEAIQDEDFEQAQLFYRKLFQLGSVHERVTYQSALVSAEQGEMQTAYQRMKTIASPDEAGFAGAHLWIARAIARGDIESDNPERARLLRTHLRFVLASRPDHPTATVLLAHSYQESGQVKEALELMRRLPPDQLSMRSLVRLAELAAQNGNMREAQDVAARVCRHYDELSRTGDPPLTANDFLLWSAATEYLDGPAAAIEILENGLSQHADDANLRRALVSIGTAYFDLQQKQGQMTSPQQLDFLKRLLSAVPGDEGIQRRIVMLTSDLDVKTEAGRLIESGHQAGTLTANACRAMGDVAVQRSDWDRAKDWYQEAIQKDAEHHPALNNLAWLLAFRQPVDLTRALELADRAVTLQGTNPHYRETRGQIHLKLQRWPAAIVDLEYAINGMPDNLAIHDALAEAYANTGQSELAEAHRQAGARN
jgi:tetratricopeptide (TPR) repeat protein